MSKTPSKPKKKFRWVKRIFLTVVLIAIGFVGISVISEVCCSDVDPEAKTELDNLYLACRAYWLINGTEAVCTLEAASRPVYGYVQSPHIKTVAQGSQADFSGTARNPDSEKSFHIDFEGTVTEVELT